MTISTHSSFDYTCTVILLSFCRVTSNGEYTCSANFSTNGISYLSVCGRARGYQKGTTVGFYPAYMSPYFTMEVPINESYIAGLSITNTRLGGLPPLTRTIISSLMLILTILLHPPPTPAHVEMKSPLGLNGQMAV